MSNEKAWARAQRAARASYMDFSPSSELTAKYCTLTFINGSFSLTQLLMTF